MSYARDAWYVADWSHALGENPLGVALMGEPIVLWRDAAGGVRAFEDRCVHRLAPLSLGRCEGDALRCMYHGLRYDTAGRVDEIPGQDLIPKGAQVRCYPVVERHDWIWVWPGDPQRADPALIPPVVGLSDPDWVLGHGDLKYAAEARLICDNLLDFSHLTYVHADMFGAGDEFAQFQPRIEALDRGVRVTRWLPVPLGSPRNPHDVPVEAFQSYDFLVPGILLMWSANYPAGTADRLGNAAPAMADGLSGLNFTSQAVTPTGAGAARYFFSWGPHRTDGAEAKRDMMMAMAEQAFAEDRAMIEGQQRVIDATAEPRVMPTAHDRAVTLYSRLVERMAKKETTRMDTAA